MINPEVTQANIHQTICVQGWTATIRPPRSYTDKVKRQQLQAVRFMDKNPAHYEEDHFISLELGGNPRPFRPHSSALRQRTKPRLLCTRRCATAR